MSAFAKLHPTIQEAVYRLGWSSLRPLQVRAIDAVVDTAAPLILSAATASGKTEAAFLPVLSQIASTPADGIQAIYISPLKALINDQFHRLQELCDAADTPVHRWHGDVSASAKQRLREQPAGVLLITPESMESLFCNHDRHLARMFSALRFVVIDELHAFLDDVRGIHLRSLLARLELQVNVRVRRLALSATLGDFAEARRFLDPLSPDAVAVLQDDAGERELRLSVKSFYDAPSDQGDEGADESAPPPINGLAAVADDVARRFRTEANLIFCNRRQDAEILADRLHQIAEREHWPRDPFVLHHGSLSKDLREDAELRLKQGEALTAICTSTLEMGIDLGAVKSVGQIDPPWRVASLVQRLGRSGRRQGEAQVLRLYALDAEPQAKSSLTDLLYPDLIRAIAMVELHLQKWLEPSAVGRCHYSTCVHQTLSILKQTGGTNAATLLDRLCKRGAFRQITTSDYAMLLRGLASHAIIEQTPPGDLILAPEGERIVESRDFYAAFATSVDYSVEHDGDKIGVLPLTSVPPVGEHFLLAGRRWKVESIEHESRRLIVSRARGWKRPFFTGSGGEVDAHVIQTMRTVLAGEVRFAYLDAKAQERLIIAREAFATHGLHESGIIESGADTLWFTWQGSRVCEALLLCARTEGIPASWDGMAVHYPRLKGDAFREHLRHLAAANLESLLVETLTEQELLRDRFDHLVPAALLKQAWLTERVNLDALRQTLGDAEKSCALEQA
ncbi:MAG: DEAD/DEAH box helicase [Verrucomicrobiaceae bacterium]|nr:DEAD/DEAH box helicase [Verrucomicrobiaceae bacterium]